MDFATFKETKTYKVLRTLGKTFLSTLLAQLIVFGDSIFAMTLTDLKTVVAAAIAAVVIALYNALNPSYTDYGIGPITTDE